GRALLGGEMSRHRVRIVVGEGRSARMGFLRFVLESEGYDVVAQASSAGELARVLAVHRPDVVVLDDGIGATAVQMTHDVSPGAKVILVWPGAVVPVGGYARVDPDDVLRSLGPTVARGATAVLRRAGAVAWNRRLGVIALGGAVAASAVVIALTLGGSGGQQGILSAAGFVQEPPAAAAPAPGASLIGGVGQAGF